MLPATDDPHRMRRADARLLADAFGQARHQLLGLFGAYEQALNDVRMRVPFSSELNLPLWELGHIGWFEDYWLSRFCARRAGERADPDAPREAPFRVGADGLYDSSHVAHATRWQLSLPGADATRRDLQHIREHSLALLAQSAAGDDALYFFRLVLFHEDMHREAWIYMAQNLGIELGSAFDATGPVCASADGEWALPRRELLMGSGKEGFAFDNECGQHRITLAPTRIDRTCVSWQRFLPFVEAGGYADAQWWSRQGWGWKQQRTGPRYLRREVGVWQRQQFGRWVALDPAQPATNLCAHEAMAWCRWAGRRLPREAEWESAATSAAESGEPFEWGQVWEWTASAFAPYPGFVPHPYRDYSVPWFDGRPVLRGASFATAPRMKHPRFRNFFSAERNDIFAGFRSCAI